MSVVPQSRVPCVSDGTQLMEIKCVGIEKCGNCLNVCPHGAITPGKRKTPMGDEEITLVTVDRSSATTAAVCQACTSKALYMCGTDYTVDERSWSGSVAIFRSLKIRRRRDGFWRRVPLSAEFLLEILKTCKAEGFYGCRHHRLCQMGSDRADPAVHRPFPAGY